MSNVLQERLAVQNEYTQIIWYKKPGGVKQQRNNDKTMFMFSLRCYILTTLLLIDLILMTAVLLKMLLVIA